MSRPLAWGAIAIAIGLVLVGSAPVAGASPVSVGKFVAPGAVAAVYAQSGNPGAAPFTQTVLPDGSLVYDTTLWVEIVNANEVAVALNISVEQYTPGTERVLGPNNTTVVVPADLDAVYRNSTVTVAAVSVFTDAVPLPQADSQRNLRVTVGSAAWGLFHLTPRTSSLASVYTVGGVELVAIAETALTALALYGGNLFARALVRRVTRTPKPSPVWAAVWLLGPPFAFLAYYVPVNQLLGSVDIFVYPFVAVVALFPYLCRAHRTGKVTRLNSVEARTADDLAAAESELILVRTAGRLRRSPETWREVLYTLLGVPLPELEGVPVTVGGKGVPLIPRSLPTTSPLGPEYATGADEVLWYDPRQPFDNRRHRFRFTREGTREVRRRREDGTATAVVDHVPHRRFSPHVERGRVRATLVFHGDPAQFASSLRSLEDAWSAHEATRLLNAELRGSIPRREREAAELAVDIALEATYEAGHIRSEDELARTAELYRRERAKTAGGEGAGTGDSR